MGPFHQPPLEGVPLQEALPDELKKQAESRGRSEDRPVDKIAKCLSSHLVKTFP